MTPGRERSEYLEKQVRIAEEMIVDRDNTIAELIIKLAAERKVSAQLLEVLEEISLESICPICNCYEDHHETCRLQAAIRAADPTPPPPAGVSHSIRGG